MKGQGSVEFIMILSILLVMLAAIAVASTAKTRDINAYAFQREADSVLGYAGSKINTAYLEGDGFETNITLPERIMGFDYNVSVEDDYLVINSSGMGYSKLLATNVSGQLAKGLNVVRNEKGEVKVI